MGSGGGEHALLLLGHWLLIRLDMQHKRTETVPRVLSGLNACVVTWLLYALKQHIKSSDHSVLSRLQITAMSQ